MLVTAWILLIGFSVPSFYFCNFFNSKKNITVAGIMVWIFSMFVVAFSAGIIWGGLFG